MSSKEPSLFYLRLEEAPQLLVLCREKGIPVEDLAGLPPKRQREKAAERLLLCEAFGKPVTLAHTEQGAPMVEGSDMNISISHTMRLVVVALSENQVIGVDAEQADRQQVIKVRDKFLNTSEKQFIDPDDLAAHIIAWTAKEAVIKAERNSAIDWTEGICLESFTPDPVETVFAARCGDRLYNLVTRREEGHYITLAVPANQ
ncbi:MAG: 4'-phosphopantetheinyl transferase superfamily protein [Muribaculaceae bacterium]|nr:4'-phosphopantetheinyl transferase superfamily protein [Muribaculaceae bacterium]